MSKPKTPRALEDHQAQAIVSNLRVSPRKLNLVAGLIRNLPASQAVANNHQLDVDRLVVSRAEVGRSIVMRRFHARGRGRAARVEKWFSHLKIVVAERDQEDEFEATQGVAERTQVAVPPGVDVAARAPVDVPVDTPASPAQENAGGGQEAV